MSTYNVVLNCQKPEKKLPEVYGISFDEKQNEVVFFSHKMINKGIENYSLKKKTPKENLSQSNAAILKLWCPYVYQWFISCAITLLTKRALKSVELNELYPLFFRLTCNILLTFVLNLKKVPAINDVVRLGESRVLFNITLRGH